MIKWKNVNQVLIIKINMSVVLGGFDSFRIFGFVAVFMRFLCDAFFSWLNLS